MNELKRTALKQELLAYLTQNFETCLQEHKFDKKRKFKFDYAIPELKIAIEVNGGQWIAGGGRHNRGGKSYQNDLRKLNLAHSQGWRVFQYTYEMLATLEYKVSFVNITLI